MSNTIETEYLFKAFLEIFDELYDGPKSDWTWVTTNGPDTSIMGTLNNLSPEEASVLHPSGQSIASHAEHLRWSLVLANSYFRGETPKPDWEESWKVTTVDAAQWDKLRADLKHKESIVREAVEGFPDWSNPIFFRGTLALVPHAAYHLGAIRQMLPAVKNKQRAGGN